MNKDIEKGYIGQTEVNRRALLAYERMLDEEEVHMVNKSIEAEMQEIHEGKIKTKSIKQIKKKYKL